MHRPFFRTLVAFLAFLAFAFLCDGVWLRIRMSRDPNSVTDTVQVEVIEQIPQKGNKAEYVPEAPQPETCVRSLFPHGGSSPCWYLRRHATRQINF